jgi:hypothetical protein
LKDSPRFREAMNRINELLAEGASGRGRGAGRKVAEREALEDAERIVRTLVDHPDRELAGDYSTSSISWVGGNSDANSMADSEYTVRSISSFNERTSYFFRPRHNRGR